MNNRNLTLMTDLYQLTTIYGYYKCGTHLNTAVFDLFFRPKGELNYAVFAGLEQAIEYLKDLHFSLEDIEYLKSLKIFDNDFLEYLKNFHFEGDIFSCEEGEIVFPYEPIITVRAPMAVAQLIETALLNIVCHQTLIATKASRIVHAADGKQVTEFGLRRAQGPDAGIYGARASIIGGCNGTSNVLAGQMFDIAAKGTHAHSWVMSFSSEEEAFDKFAEIYPDSCLLLIDTYDSLKSGIPNAIKTFNKLKAKGHKPLGIRLDSGDLAYLSKKARQMLDEAGFKDAIIFASGDIDEDVISSLRLQGAKIDVYGVGTKLITSENTPSLGGVYKLAQIERNGKEYPCMKISDNFIKITNPGYKKLYRIYSKEHGKALADLITLKDEKLERPLTLTHETERWKHITLNDYLYRELQVPIFRDGKLVYKCPALMESAQKKSQEYDKFWNEYKRLVRPHIYKVNLSNRLYDLKQQLLIKEGAKNEI